MKNVLLIGASGGIGAALRSKLEDAGAQVTALSRSSGLDFHAPETIETVLSELSTGFDGILVASGALSVTTARPEKSLSELTSEELTAQFAVNTIGPAMVLRLAPRLLRRDAHCVFAAISAKVGSIGDNRLGGWYSYRASKAALNQIIRTGAIELARSHRQSICVALHPGTVDTAFTQNYPAHKKTAPETSAANLLKVLNGLSPADTGQFYNWDGTQLPW
ncbi:SDR family NAD(P)-dependent oxidoreductase [uncultured Shimia sp.]|uniref:SDR family NAD(P)-dependent oxidoreductase n=1 Tax=uncultured Shimia sp. TaxID=573152 RepID=UPI0026207A3F|nr:SDR family NAD(P)-dependent oxidoreductase [uncultured Shimia sp.]